MAYGSELFLGIVGKKAVKDTLKSLGLKYSRFDGVNDTAIKATMAQAQRDALVEMSLKVFDANSVKRSDKRPADTNYLYVEGPDGKLRQTCIWCLEVDYDPDEMGHEEDDMLLGVSLISRYFPVFLDWDKDHGGSGDGVILTPDLLKNIEIARKHLAPILPFIQAAPIIFRERHY